MINKSNIEEKLFDYFEGNLSATEVSEVDNFVQNNPEFKSDFDAWKQSYLPAETFEYKHANDLLVPENSKKALFGRWKTGLAMLLLSSGVSFGIYISLNNNSKVVTENINTFKQTKNEQAINKTNNANNLAENKFNSLEVIENKNSQAESTNLASTLKNTSGNSNSTNKPLNAYQHKKITLTTKGNLNANNLNTNDEAKHNSPIHKQEITSKHLPISMHKKSMAKLENGNKPTLNKKKSKFEKYDKNVLKFSNNKDPYLSFPNTSALDLNPSFTGNSKGIRLNYLYHNQWPELNDNDKFVTQIISVDGYVKALKGGLGVVLLNDVMGHKKFSSQSVSFIYSPKFNLFGKTTIEPSFKYSYNKKSVTWNQLKNDELIDPRNGMLNAVIANNPENVATTHSTFSSFGTGLLLNTSKVYVGIAYDYWRNPNYNLDGYSQQIDVPGKFSAQFGGSLIPIKDKDFTLSPAVQYLKIGNWDNLWFSNTFEISKFFLSTSMSVNKESMFSAGYNNDYLRISYATSEANLLEACKRLMEACKLLS